TRDDAFAIVGGMQPAFEDDLHTVVDGGPSPDGVARRVSRGCAGQVLLEKGGDALEEILVEKARLASAARAPGAAPGNDDLGGDEARLDQQAVVVQAGLGHLAGERRRLARARRGDVGARGVDDGGADQRDHDDRDHHQHEAETTFASHAAHRIPLQWMYPENTFNSKRLSTWITRAVPGRSGSRSMPPW